MMIFRVFHFLALFCVCEVCASQNRPDLVSNIRQGNTHIYDVVMGSGMHMEEGLVSCSLVSAGVTVIDGSLLVSNKTNGVQFLMNSIKHNSEFQAYKVGINNARHPVVHQNWTGSYQCEYNSTSTTRSVNTFDLIVLESVEFTKATLNTAPINLAGSPNVSTSNLMCCARGYPSPNIEFSFTPQSMIRLSSNYTTAEDKFSSCLHVNFTVEGAQAGDILSATCSASLPYTAENCSTDALRRYCRSNITFTENSTISSTLTEITLPTTVSFRPTTIDNVSFVGTNSSSTNITTTGFWLLLLSALSSILFIEICGAV